MSRIRKVRCPHCRVMFRPKNASGTLPKHYADCDGPGYPYECPMYGTYPNPISSKAGAEREARRKRP